MWCAVREGGGGRAYGWVGSRATRTVWSCEKWKHSSSSVSLSKGCQWERNRTP